MLSQRVGGGKDSQHTFYVHGNTPAPVLWLALQLRAQSRTRVYF